MRRFLSVFASAVVFAAATASGADPEGAEALAPATPKKAVAPAAPPQAAVVEPVHPAVGPAGTHRAVRDSADTAAAKQAPASVKTDSVSPSAPDGGTAAGLDSLDQRTVAEPKPLVPLAAPSAPAAEVSTGSTTASPAPFVVQERRDTARKAPVRVRTIAIGLDTAGSSRDHRSTWAAVGLTMLLPGAGHRYLGHNTGAAVWMTTDLLLWSGLAIAWQMGDLYVQDAAEIANRHAGASLGSDPDIDLLETMRDWRSRRPVAGRRDSYDEALLQQGLATDYRFPQDAAHDWDWGSPENPENNEHIARFEDALKGYRTSRIALTYAAGGLLVSRAIAVADILRIRRKSASRAGIHALVVPRLDGAQGLVSYQF